MLVSLIAAMTPDLVIGKKDGGIPWNLPRDKQHFRDYTAGKWVLSGRTTYEEMLGWFQDRVPIILTRSPRYETESPAHRVAGTVSDAISLAKNNGAEELVVLGGSSVFEAAIPHARRLLITVVNKDYPGEVRFPDYREHYQWKTVHREFWKQDEENECDMTLKILDLE